MLAGMKSLRIAGLDCVLAGGDDDDGGGDGPMVVLLHGFGAGGDDLVALAAWIDAPPGTRWVFPAGLLELGGAYGDARAWWRLDLERIERDLASGRGADRAAEIPDGLAAARAAVSDLLAALERDHQRRDAATVLGGFSQGAMLTVDVALATARPLAGLIVLSGVIIAEAEWKPRAAALAGRLVLQTHGTMDGLLSFAGGERLHGFLAEAGAAVGFVPFPGGHEIPPPVLELAGDFLTRAFGSAAA